MEPINPKFHLASLENSLKVRQAAARWRVSVEYLVSILRKRRAYREASMYRRRSRERAIAWCRNRHEIPKVQKKRADRVYTGEGPLHTLMRMIGIGRSEFCRTVGIHETTFCKWQGWPLSPWPVRFLELLYYARGMEKTLRNMGIDTEQFKPVLPKERNTAGRYPRKTGQVNVANAPLKDEWTPYMERFR